MLHKTASTETRIHQKEASTLAPRVPAVLAHPSNSHDDNIRFYSHSHSDSHHSHQYHHHQHHPLHIPSPPPPPQSPHHTHSTSPAQPSPHSENTATPNRSHQASCSRLARAPAAPAVVPECSPAFRACSRECCSWRGGPRAVRAGIRVARAACRAPCLS